MEEQISKHYFLALELSAELKKWLKQKQSMLQSIIGEKTYKTWTDQADFHITLAFFGELTDVEKTTLVHKISQISQLKSFVIKIGDIGYFGHGNQPRVLWMRAAKNQDITRLLKQIHQQMESLNLPIDQRVFCPHITLAKKATHKWLTDDGWSELAANFVDSFQERISTMVLYRVQMQHIPRYQCVERFKLE
ncbi:RNA 2',3'-cyclic phosphodiesterase [Amphibacillus cookii]|uniref:RNA 2',3'-cyclic phosphodiesterase n=1 Tax=Amphibacillus cookii TaxID=767787 RepID=UPI00195B5F19|nr:RNA 2',3'-cyclic phosphodiesterase [Amphibacillus cookii]MBM7542977.1 2'-5' RNA ligase [Amphibacillus cookii]